MTPNGSLILDVKIYSSVQISLSLEEFQCLDQMFRFYVSLSAEQDQYKIPVFVRRNPKFRLPRRATVPIIMVGPGTGLAPFRGFIQHRAAIARDGRECGENLLFFGCRHENKDFLYQEELMEYKKEGILQLYTAFSRDTVREICSFLLMLSKSVA